MSDFVLQVIAFLAVIGPLIIIHELGHFVACRMVGVTVLEFGVGFPPRAVKLFERGGTEFTLNWLPIGGFVRPLGEDFVKPVGVEATEEEKARYAQYQAELAALGKKAGGPIKAVMDVGPWSRMWFLIAGSFFNVIAAFVLLVIVAMISLPPQVTSPSPRSPAASAGLLRGDVILEVNGKSYGRSQDIRQTLAEAKGAPVALLIDRQGERKTITLDATNAQRFQPGGVMIVATSPGMPAAGIFEPGDVIMRVDNRGLFQTVSIQEYIRERPDTPIRFMVWRKGEEKVLEVSPKKTDSGQVMIGVSLVPLDFELTYGLALQDRAIGAPLGEAIGEGARLTGEILQRLIAFPVDLARGALSADEARPVSIVGITQIGGEAVQRTVEDRSPFWVLQFAALISLALGFTNLLPIPGLDGGRILFVIIELIRGRPMNQEREGLIHMIGLLMLLGLFVVLVINDIANPIGPVLPR